MTRMFADDDPRVRTDTGTEIVSDQHRRNHDPAYAEPVTTWRVPVQCDGAYVLVIMADSAEEAREQVKADVAAGREVRYATATGPVTIRWGQCSVRGVGKVLPEAH